MYRNIPPLRALRAFESAARLLSFTKAAQELHLSQAAVSHQIKNLEDHLGVKLFRRLNRSLRLTEEAQIYLPMVRESLDRLENASEHMRTLERRGVLTVSVVPSFANKWLVPRLWRFTERHPEIDVRISAFEWHEDFAAQEVDMAIRYGDGQWPDLEVDQLMTEQVFPVCSPRLLRGADPLRTPEDLRDHTLLHDDFSHEDWPMWLRRAGVTGIDPSRGLRFSHTALLLEAAESGHGVALGRSPLVGDDLARGRLVKPFDLALDGTSAYYLVSPKATASLPHLAAFRRWLLEEASAQVRPSPEPASG